MKMTTTDKNQKKFKFVLSFLLSDNTIMAAEPAHVYTSKGTSTPTAKVQVPTFILTSDDMADLRREIHEEVDRLVGEAERVYLKDNV